jgi:hypothetical protein
LRTIIALAQPLIDAVEWQRAADIALYRRGTTVIEHFSAVTLLGDYWNAKECARRLGRSADTLCRWRKRKKGPPFLRIGGRVFYKPEDVLGWIDSSRLSWMNKDRKR